MLNIGGKQCEEIDCTPIFVSMNGKVEGPLIYWV